MVRANTGWFDLVYNNASQVGNYSLKILHNFLTNFAINKISGKSEKIWRLQSDSMSTIWPKRGRHSIFHVFFHITSVWSFDIFVILMTVDIWFPGNFSCCTIHQKVMPYFEGIVSHLQSIIIHQIKSTCIGSHLLKGF